MEDLAFEAVLRMAKFLEDNPDMMVPPTYIRQLKEAYAIVSANNKTIGLDEDAEPEELLVRLEEVKARLQRKVQQKHAAQAAKAAIEGLGISSVDTKH